MGGARPKTEGRTAPDPTAVFATGTAEIKSEDRLREVAAALRLTPVAPPTLPAPPPAQAAPASRRKLWLAVAAAVLALVVAGTGLLVARPAALFGTAAAPTHSPSASPLATPSPVLAGAPADATLPSAAAVAAALQGPLADPRLGGHVGIRVVDVSTGQQLYAKSETDPITPASTMKLATSVALLALRGPAYQIETTAVAGANPGEVVLVGGGDPTLQAGATGSYPGAARLDDLANQVRQALGGTAPTKVIVDSSLFSGPNTGPDWEASDYDAGGQVSRITALMTDGGRTNPAKIGPPSARYQRPDLAAGQAFAKLLGLPASAVAMGTQPAKASPSAAPTAPGTRLGVVKSPPVVSLIEQLLASSDNTIAECMARQVALAAGQPASFAGGAQAVTGELTKLGLPLGNVHIVDGSGLSADNKLTPQLLTALLALAAKADHPQLHGLFTGLPVAGYSGTLADRFRTPAANPADGLVRAKTGTLTGVNTLAGYVTTTGGRLLAFAVMADQVAANVLEAEAALDRVGTALAQLP
jgi:serine-type D-Ala-D-Ala carboxypeptidase/endopeptidase (penicillin-binding protein 4)